MNQKYSNDNTSQNDLYDNLKEKFEQLMNHEIEIQKKNRRERKGERTNKERNETKER